MSENENKNQPQNNGQDVDNQAVGQFGIPYKTLIDLATACKSRKFAEEVEMYEGDQWLERGLCTNLKTGLSGQDQDMEERNVAFGNNMESSRPPQSFFTLICMALEDFTLRILIMSSIFSITIQTATADADHRSYAWIEGFAIMVAVFVCAVVTSVNDYQKERQFQELNQVAGDRKRVGVIRGGTLKIIHQSLVMVGDVMTLEEGMEIPADGIVIEANELTTDEAAMTGEPDPIKKSPYQQCFAQMKAIIQEGGRNDAKSHDVPSLIIMSGTRILTGNGKMVIITVGPQSVIGQIQAILKQEDDSITPLQQKLEHIANDIGTMGLVSAILILLILFIRFAVERGQEGKFDHSKHWGEMVKFFIIGITVIVVAIPEGLPLAVTLSLAYSVKKMLKQNNLVRKMQACETMGGADCICSDQTGTLTTNQMTLTHWWNETVDELPYNNQSIDLSTILPQTIKDLWLVSLSCNGDAILQPEPKGSRTEIAILQFLEKCGIDYDDYRTRLNVATAETKFPFSSARKRMGIILNYDGKERLFEKGGSDKITAACTHFHRRSNNQVVPIDKKLEEEIAGAIQNMADKALRTIGFAYQDISPGEDLVQKDDKSGVFNVEMKNLVLVGILGIADVLREEVPGAIRQCQTAGIQVRMVTGDNKDTARAIARDCGIVSSDEDMVLQGQDFIQRTGGIMCRWCKKNEDCKCPLDSDTLQKTQKQAVSAIEQIKKKSSDELNRIQNNKSILDDGGNQKDITPQDIKDVRLYQLSILNIDELKVRDDTLKDMENFKSFYPRLAVMARSQPEHKYALVTGLRECKHVVAVTGDGTNDAPALKKADVGFAMGIAGTEVAREAAAIILLDDNFKSIVVACMWGRNIYDSIKKFIQFQLTVNVVAVFMTLIGASALKQEVLKPIQMLWVNLIMDTFASLALATEPPTEALLLRKPQGRDEYIISQKMFKHIFGQAFLQLIILNIFLFGGEYFLPEYKDTWDDDWKGRLLTDPRFKERFQFWWQAKYHDETLSNIRSGRLLSYDGFKVEYGFIQSEYNLPSRHFTYIFVVFVLLQLFNFVNARKLKDEFNIFEGFSRNPMFILIVGFCLVLQILITTFGGIAFYCYKPYGLTIQQWLICVGFASLGWIMGVILKLVPEDQCFQTGNQQMDPTKTPSQVLGLKHGSNSHIRRASMNNGNKGSITHANNVPNYQQVN